MSASRSAEAFALRSAEASAILREDQQKLGLWMFLATVTMLFAAFTSAYIVRRSGSDWRHVALPSILRTNSLVLVASSIAVEFAQWFHARDRKRAVTAAMLVALALGLVFLGGQIVAWRQMIAAGVYLPTSPHSSFFFMLTGAHAVHVVAALAVLGWGTFTSKLTIARTFWHYLGGVWLFLFALVTLV